MATGRHTDSSAVLATPRRSTGRLPSKLHPKVLRRKVFGVPGGTSAQLAFVASSSRRSASVSDAGFSLQQRAFEFAA
ncbi:hypothetical protein MSIMFB_03324 [Mycobacterium simulans]|uniref:Uncharacterized protein n=2 Tax=Mycobacterium TaxID=1763 RepID=A0A7Z7NAH6_9MYCO|nr:hypothetical protein MSIMFB_03324 [Mycobacterium simulans]VTO95524.1 hypothetical protein BIN_B_01004 [Mycobacterium riyadhense]